jgi:hypothetical protein
MRAQRLGAQTALPLENRVNRTPAAARASTLGVRMRVCP